MRAKAEAFLDLGPMHQARKLSGRKEMGMHRMNLMQLNQMDQIASEQALFPAEYCLAFCPRD